MEMTPTSEVHARTNARTRARAHTTLSGCVCGDGGGSVPGCAVATECPEAVAGDSHGVIFYSCQLVNLAIKPDLLRWIE